MRFCFYCESADRKGKSMTSYPQLALMSDSLGLRPFIIPPLFDSQTGKNRSAGCFFSFLLPLHFILWFFFVFISTFNISKSFDLQRVHIQGRICVALPHSFCQLCNLLYTVGVTLLIEPHLCKCGVLRQTSPFLVSTS